MLFSLQQHINNMDLYSFLLVIGSLMAAVRNTIALVVLLQPRMRSKSNKLLTSLAVSDALVTYVLIPFIAIQVMYKENLINCQMKHIREFLSYILVPVSGYTILLISYDRYISLTKITRYHTIVTNKKVNIWICLSWCFPISLMTLNTLGTFKNYS